MERREGHLPGPDGLQDQEEAEANEDAFAFSATAFPSDGDEPTGEELRQISGIGPRFQAALRKQGITRLSQIAAWSDADVRQVAKALRIPKSRIVKGRWIESAREAIGSRAASE
jgi:predicted flap endonuclease-1-like 5' DNA nuclease